jgi:hypothetical protein
MPPTLTEYFLRASGARSIRAVARAIDMDQSTLRRQLTGTNALPVETVVAICRAFRIPLADAFVAAGYITEEEAKTIGSDRSLAAATDRELTAEMVRRLNRGEAGPDITDPISDEIIRDAIPYIGPAAVPDQIAADTRPRKGDEPPVAE